MNAALSGGIQAILLLVIISGRPASAEWVSIDGQYQSPGLRTIYIDPASVRRNDNLVTLSVLIDWRSMQGGRSPTRFYSTTFTKQFDCVQKRVRSLAAADFYGHMGTGTASPGIVPANESIWGIVEPGSLGQGLWETACGHLDVLR